MSRKSRRKGKAYENKIARDIRGALTADAKRHLEYQYQEAEESRDIDTDIPFAIQCKHWKKTPSISTMDDIETSKDYPHRLAVLKRSRGDGKGMLEVAVLDWEVFLEILVVLEDNELLDSLR